MSSHDQAAAVALAHLALACDGAVLGVTLAIVAVQTWLKFRRSSRALARIQSAPAVRISDLRSLLASPDTDSPDAASAAAADSHGGKLVVVRGRVDTKSAVDGNWISLKDKLLFSNESGEGAVVIQRTQTCLYNEWRGLFGWTFDLHSLFAKSWKEHESTSLRTVPFVLIEGGYWPRAGYVVVNLDDSIHHLPLTTVYHQLRPVHASPYTIFQAIFGHGYPVGLLDEEKILPIGKEITAVGTCSLQGGVPEIKSCKELPYFLSDMTKDQMEGDLGIRTNVLFWSGIVLGTLSFGILGYSIVRFVRPNQLVGWHINITVGPGKFLMELVQMERVETSEATASSATERCYC
ncbi:E3 ubiquitin-protein ligase SPL2 isoform X2 [Magnolia sinica]|uniref:E3 ubiquitin-protein ligase SPL2 isoform X2 n=1 Tax=Magnolia sinica TaxID=86752 RepID=UPI002659FF2D|nr:E3 ubiquitin-protein ligase SPL2 isoform X2 [Magnolia sinica]